MATFSSFLGSALANGPTEGRHHYLVVDGSVAQGRDMTAELRINTTAIDILTGEPCRWRDCGSPVLLSLPTQQLSPSAAHATERAIEKWRYANAFVYVESTLSNEQMRLALMARSDAVLPDNLEVLLRFFDARVLDRVLVALSAEQRLNFLSVGTTWAFPDRWGHLRIERGVLAADTFVGPLRLNERQEAALIDAGEPDALIDSLMNQNHPILERLLPPEQFENVSAALAQAQSLGIHQHGAQLAFCSLSLELGLNFFEQVPWSQWMPDVKSGKRCFNDVVTLAAESEYP